MHRVRCIARPLRRNHGLQHFGKCKSGVAIMPAANRRAHTAHRRPARIETGAWSCARVSWQSGPHGHRLGLMACATAAIRCSATAQSTLRLCVPLDRSRVILQDACTVVIKNGYDAHRSSKISSLTGAASRCGATMMATLRPASARPARGSKAAYRSRGGLPRNQRHAAVDGARR